MKQYVGPELKLLKQNVENELNLNHFGKAQLEINCTEATKAHSSEKVHPINSIMSKQGQ